MTEPSRRDLPTSGDQQVPAVSELVAQRKATQPTNKRTFGSVFKNPEHELGAGRMLEECGLKAHRIVSPSSHESVRPMNIRWVPPRSASRGV